MIQVIQHLGHLVLAGVGLVFMAVALIDQARIRARRRREGGQPVTPQKPVPRRVAVVEMRGPTTRHAEREVRLRHLAALLALVAGAIHFLVAPEHFAEGIAVGAFMVVAGSAQVAAGVLLLVRPSRAVLLASIAGTVGIVALYAVSRTIGLPVGPAPWVPEPVGLIDIASKVTEVEFLAAAMALLTMDRWPVRPRRSLKPAPQA